MFNVNWTEIMLIAGVAVLVISPKDLPRAMRTVGKYVGQMRRMARGFQGQLNEALREAELDDVRKEVTEIGKIDPLGDIRKDISKTERDLRKDLTITDGAGAAAKTESAPAAVAPAAASGGTADAKPAIAEPEATAVAPKAKAVAPKAPAAAEPKAATVEPKAAAVAPKADAVDPKPTAVEPKAPAAEPKAAAVEPKSGAAAEASS